MARILRATYARFASEFSVVHRSFDGENKDMMNFDRSSGWLAVAIISYAVTTDPCSIAKADPPATKTPSIEPAAEESLDVRHARAHLELAKLDLRRAQEWNKRLPHLYSARTMDYLRKHVEIDREQLKQIVGRQYADVNEIYVRGAKAAVELADADVQRKQVMFKLAPDDYNALELDRAIAVAKVAKLNYERTAAQKNSIHTLSNLQWQIEELRNQLLELQIRVEKSARR
jgi:hypothetical protein